MYTPERPGRVENYTNASLMMGFVNLLWILGVIWALFGIFAVMLIGWVCNLLISWLDSYRRARDYANRWPRTP